MGFRRFTDRDGHQWEVQDRSSVEWTFEPVGGNPHRPERVRVPIHQNDPFELSDQELQALLGPGPGRSKQAKSPFTD